MRYRAVTNALDKKVPGRAPGSKERHCWVVFDGRRIAKVAFPKIHEGDIPPGTLNNIRKDLRLTLGQFKDFVACKLTSTQYERLLRIFEARLKLNDCFRVGAAVDILRWGTGSVRGSVHGAVSTEEDSVSVDVARDGNPGVPDLVVVHLGDIQTVTKL